MVSTFNLHDVQESVDNDLTDLELYVRQLVGEPFLFFRESYAGEIGIHFGAVVQRKSPKLKDRARGSYVLTVRASLWMVISKDALVLSDPAKQLRDAESRRLTAIDIEKSPPLKPGSQLVWILPFADDLSGGIGLGMGFSDQARFVIHPEPPALPDANRAEEELPGIADWELRTPIGRYLTVGPGRRWAYLPSTNQQ